MKRYTVDANALVDFTLGILPDTAHEQFRAAADGRVTLEIPVIAAVEAMFVLDRRDELQGTPIPFDAEDVLRWFEQLPATFVEDTHADARELLSHLSTFPAQMHDAMIVSNHINRSTDAIITDDEKMADHYPTLWD
jgi:predicted nucleic acid-binding protein